MDDVANDRLNKLIDNSRRHKPDIKIGGNIFYWGYEHRWLRPEGVVNVGTTIIKFVHSDETLTSIFNRVQKTISPMYPIYVVDEEIIPSTSANREYDETESHAHNNSTDNQVFSAPMTTRLRSQKPGGG